MSPDYVIKKEGEWTEEQAAAKEAYYKRHIRQERTRADHGKARQLSKSVQKRRKAKKNKRK